MTPVTAPLVSPAPSASSPAGSPPLLSTMLIAWRSVRFSPSRSAATWSKALSWFPATRNSPISSPISSFLGFRPGVTIISYLLRYLAPKQLSGQTEHRAGRRRKETEMATEMRLELMQVPVSDIDRAKSFYVDKVGFNADHGHRGG